MKKADDFISDYHKPIFSRGWSIGFLSLVLISVFALSIWNAAKLQVALDSTTQEYLTDVTSQLSRDIRDAINHKIINLVMTADSLSQFTETQDMGAVSGFLTRKAQILEFDPLILFDKEQRFVASETESGKVPAHPEDFLSLPSIQSSFQGNIQASYMGGKSIFYSVPVYRGGQVGGVLVGMRSKENMQSLISSKSFSGQMLSCIVDSRGQVVIAPTDLKPFLQLDDIFKNEKNKQVIADIRQMQKDMAENRDGILRFTAVTKEELVLSYNALNLNDWFLLTIIPADIISGGLSRYILQSFVIIGATILIFSLFLFAVFRFYNAHKRQLELIAYSDPLTGGLNNAAFQARYRELSKTMEPCSYSIVLLNVRGFKLVNEQFGIPTGNQTLSYIYRVLKQHVRQAQDEFVARGESDHFFLCLKEYTQAALQCRLNDMIHDINTFQDTDLPFLALSFKQGACIVNDPDQEITLLQDHARLALQNSGTDIRHECSFYNESLTRHLKLEQELNALFEDSIENRHFQVYLQPKIGLKSNLLEGAEALVRWNHPQRGIIFPSEFIPLFESNGKICRLDLYVFEEVCAAMERWKQAGLPLVPVSVNLSRQHFRDAGFLDTFAGIASRFSIPDNVLEFELTESIFFDNQQIRTVRQAIQEMHSMGFLCSLDDFGSGFSSLGLLKEFDVDSLKLDRSFFLNMSGRKAKDVIACLIDLARHLKVKTVAEGIESMDQVDLLRSMGCDMVQGYVFSAPLPMAEFETRYLYRQGSDTAPARS